MENLMNKKIKIICATVIFMSGLSQTPDIKANIFDDIGDFFDDVGNAFKSVADLIGDNVVNLSTSLYDKTKDFATQIGNGVASLGTDFYNNVIKPAAMAIYDKALIPIKNVATDFADRVKECGYLAQDSG